MQFLQITLVLCWPYHRVAVTVLEEGGDHSSGPIFVLDGVRSAALLPQRLLQILFRVDLVSIVVEEAQCEVSDHPHEGREKLRKLVRIALVLLRSRRDTACRSAHFTGARIAHTTISHLNRFGEVDDEGEVLQGLLVDRSHRIEDKVGAQEEREQENARIMVLIFVESPNALAIDNQALKWLFRSAVDEVYGLVPDPEALGAWVDRWPNTEPARLLLLKEDSVEEKRLAGTIFTGDGDHSHVVIFQVHEKVSGLLAHREPYTPH